MKFNLAYLVILANAALACDREGYHCVGRGKGEPSSCCGGLVCLLDDGEHAGGGRIGTCVSGALAGVPIDTYCDREGYHCVGRGCGEPSSCCGGLKCMRDDGSCAGNGLIGTCVTGSITSLTAPTCDREGYHCVGRGCGEPSSCCGGLACMRDDGSCAGNGLIGTCVVGSASAEL